MVSKITKGIEVKVETFYQQEQSNALAGDFTFAYQVTIENLNNYAIKLVARTWFIFDSNGQRRNVEGEGVVGVQPVLAPQQIFQYVSGCNFRTEMGRMYGFYTFQNLDTLEYFQVHIPTFDCIAPSKMN